jgi:poly(ADP-ribose) glycohydrolase
MREEDDDGPYSHSIVSYFPHKFPELWKITQDKFNTDIKTISDINTTFYEGKSNFFKEIEKTYPEQGNEFIKVFGNIRNLVLDSEKILKDEIKILSTKTTDKIILNRKQVALIFILGFFDIFNLDMKLLQVDVRYNFYDILKSNRGSDLSKARSFLNYLIVIGRWLEEKNPLLEENVTFIRENKKCDFNDFDGNQKFCDIQIIEKGSLFDSEASFYVDFANQYIGGGVLSGGCVQEEILFTVNPEAVVSIFLMRKMEDKDAIRIDNIIQYSNYSGYGRTFKFEDDATKDITKIKKHNIIAIDAVCTYSSGRVDKDSVDRDFIKAYVGFNLINFKDENVIKLKKQLQLGIGDVAHLEAILN